MSQDSSQNAGLGIVMTDLFVSATAALMIVLSLLQTNPIARLPVQADLFARCSDENLTLALTDVKRTRIVLVEKAADLLKIPVELELPPQLHYSVAFQPGPNGLFANCLEHATRRIFGVYNSELLPKVEAGQSRPVFSVIAVPSVDEDSQ